MDKVLVGLIDSSDEPLEGLEAAVLFFEPGDNLVASAVVGGSDEYGEAGGGFEADLCLVTDEIREKPVDLRKAFTAVESVDGVGGGVRRRGGDRGGSGGGVHCIGWGGLIGRGWCKVGGCSARPLCSFL